MDATLKKLTPLLIVVLFAVVFSQALPKTQHPQWYGIGDDWRLWMDIDSALATWNALLPHLKVRWGFNTVRLAFSFSDSGGETHTVLDYGELDRVLDVVGRYGFRAVLDLHNWQDMRGYFGSPQWMQQWSALSSRYRDDARVVAYGLFNEPFRETWHSSVEDVLSAYVNCIDAIRATGDQHTIVLPPPPLFMATMENAFDSESIPERLRRENVVVSHHAWFMDETALMEKVEFDRALMDAWENMWMAECGVVFEYDREAQENYFKEVVRLCRQRGMGFCVWLYRIDPQLYDGLLM